ncbi:glycosyltransferase family 2 protein [Selenomonadales bacterium OttesenSCG-928-I06]|nr:glycosyltransferase family 2 protein [Selenomonadales bacterium OttesenSCG-928-I06]
MQASDQKTKLISIVVPVYNEQENIEAFYQEVLTAMENIPYQFEIIFVDDGSSDFTPLILDRLRNSDSRVKAIIFSKNYGHQMALTCGMDNAYGDAVITMDGDLQHPPELIPTLIENWERGFEIVQTIRLDTEGQTWLKKITSKWFYKILNMISNTHIYPGGADFRLMDQKAVASFRLFKEKARFIRGMIGSIGYNQISIEFIAPKRFAGKSKFSITKMLRFALDGVTAYSKTPLRLAFYIGVLMFLASLGMVSYVVYVKWFTNEAVLGWATITASIFFLGGLQLLGIGIIGEYVGRVFEEVKGRPLYLVKAYLQKEENTAKTEDLTQ